MDYILSKLLPQLVYPLGLACVLLGIAFWRAKQGGRLWIGLALVALLVGGNRFVAYGLTASLEDQAVALRGEAPGVFTADTLAADSLRLEVLAARAIVVLGGGTQVLDPPRLTPEVSEGGDRVLYAAQLWRDGVAPLIVASGGGGRLGADGEQPEAAGMAALLRFVGVPDSVLVLESTSRNTYENATETKRLLSARGIDEVVLVTSAFHMPRSVRVFEAQGFTVLAAPTDFTVTEAERARARQLRLDVQVQNFLPDAEMIDLTTRALKEYIGTAVYSLRGWL